jgi:myosin heavy subunit
MAGKPYTRVGDLIIAVNPFQWMSDLYSEENRTKYVQQLVYHNNTTTTGGDIKEGLDPHVYETSCMAYRGLAVDGNHQSILVSGESGAGKTETVKIVMHHLSYVSNDNGENVVVQRVLDGQPLLEAFGNAKTVRNDNSSRFGKFIQMQFDVEDSTQAAYSGKAIPDCVLAGSTCETYLLEKSRVVSHEPDERTYHIFYQLLAASDELKQEYMPQLLGKTAVDFTTVGHSDTTEIEGLRDGDRFVKTLEALKLLDMTHESLQTLFGAVSVVMQLGNIVFDEDPDESEKCVIAGDRNNNQDQSPLTTLATWFGCSSDSLEQALTYRTVVAGGEQYKVPLKKDDAQDGAHAFAKEIYQQVFLWLVRELNRMTCAENNYNDAPDVEVYGLIGLLDIFGFESFEVNRFEQLCINYTNEKLQQKYTLDIFQSVQEEYSHEGIELGEITFADNAEVLRLIEGKIGIISVLNEECVRPKGNDTAFVSKVKSVNKEVTCLISEKLHKPTEFTIEHYAGPVTYDATNFVQKNTDALPNDIIECACLSTNKIINTELKAAADAKVNSGVSKRGALTVASKFKSQLTHLMADVTQTKTRYIRCIKPNPEKAPLKMNMFSSAEQLRCAGVVAAVMISRVAFPNRLMHETALERFSCLSHVTLDSLIYQKKESTDDDETGYKDVVKDMFDGLLKDMEKKEEGESGLKAFECGKSRIYFRLGALESLEAKRLVALGTFATVIARIIRGFTARSLFWKLKYAATDSQANARRVVARKKYVRAKSAAINMECWVRCVFAMRELQRLKREKAATQIESRWRSFMAVVMLTKCKRATIVVQKIVRGALQRPKYRQALKEAEEEARVNSKVAALQKRLHEAEMKYFQADKKRIEAEKRAAGISGDVPTDALADTPTEAPVEAPALVSEEKTEGPESAQQKALIDESSEMLDYFRKEVFKLKSANYLLRGDLVALQGEHRALQVHAQSTEASYSAMSKNIGKLSQNNQRAARQLGEEKDFIIKLKKDLKMENIRHNADMNRKNEEVLGRDKMHDAEVARMNRELQRFQQIIAQSGGEVPAEETKTSLTKRVSEHKFERASFQHRNSVLRSLSIHKGVKYDIKGMTTSLSKASFATMDEDSEYTTTVQQQQGHRNRRPPPLKTYDNKPSVYRGGGPSPRTPLGAGRGRGRSSPTYTNSVGYASPGYNKPVVAIISPKVNPGTSLGAAAATGSKSSSSSSPQSSSLQAKTGSSSLAAAASKSGTSSLSTAAAGGGSSLSRANNAAAGATGKR